MGMWFVLLLAGVGIGFLVGLAIQWLMGL